MKSVSVSINSFRLLSISIILSLIAFSGCESKKPISIGFIAGISGRGADIGIAARDAAQLAVAQCNEQGGIHGRQVKLIIKDDRQNADVAVHAVQELFDADVAAIVGPMNSAIAMAIVPKLNEARVVAVAGTVTTPDLSGLDDFFFRVSVTAREQALRCAQYMIDSGQMRRVSVVFDADNRSLSESWVAVFKKKFTTGGGDILKVVEFAAGGNRSFSEITDDLLAVDPDGILIIANPMDSGMLCQQIRKSNPTIKITLSNWAATQRLIELGGKAVEGITIPIVFDWDSISPPYLQFRKIYFERFKRDPGYPGFYAYNAVQVVLTALDARQKGQSIKETLLSIGEFSGLQGKISFDAYGDLSPTNVSIRIVRNQKFAAVE